MTKDGSTIAIPNGHYHARYVIIANGRKAEAYGTLLTNHFGHEALVELETISATDRTHPNYIQYAHYTGKQFPW